MYSFCASFNFEFSLLPESINITSLIDKTSKIDHEVKQKNTVIIWHDIDKLKYTANTMINLFNCHGSAKLRASNSCHVFSPRLVMRPTSYITVYSHGFTVAGVLARHTVFMYRYEDTNASADLSVSIFCKVHLGKGTSM